MTWGQDMSLKDHILALLRSALRVFAALDKYESDFIHIALYVRKIILEMGCSMDFSVVDEFILRPGKIWASSERSACGFIYVPLCRRPLQNWYGPLDRIPLRIQVKLLT
jgi:hypothetical protein